MRKLQPDNLYVKSLRYLGVGNWQMHFIQVHVTSLHPLYLRSCGDSVLAIIPERISRVVLAIEIAALSKVICCANVLREEKVQCPVKCHPNLFVYTGQLAEVNGPPHPPCEEPREIKTEYARHAYPTTDGSQQPDSLE